MLTASILAKIDSFRLQFIHRTSVFLGEFQSAGQQQVGDGIVVDSVIEDIHSKSVTNKMLDLNTCLCSARILVANVSISYSAGVFSCTGLALVSPVLYLVLIRITADYSMSISR